MATTILVRRTRAPVLFSSTTGFVHWKTQDVADLDCTPLPIVRRDNTEDALQFTREVRFASGDAAAIGLTADVRMRWQGGLFLFTQGYEQDAINFLGT